MKLKTVKMNYLEKKPKSFEGVIKRVKFHNPLNGYGILSVEIIEITYTGLQKFLAYT